MQIVSEVNTWTFFSDDLKTARLVKVLLNIFSKGSQHVGKNEQEDKS